MKQIVDGILYIDPQTAVPAGYCPHCGGALYRPSLQCLRCGRQAP